MGHSLNFNAKLGNSRVRLVIQKPRTQQIKAKAGRGNDIISLGRGVRRVRLKEIFNITSLRSLGGHYSRGKHPSHRLRVASTNLWALKCLYRQTRYGQKLGYVYLTSNPRCMPNSKLERYFNVSCCLYASQRRLTILFVINVYVSSLYTSIGTNRGYA